MYSARTTHWTIGQLAQRAGLNPKTIRYYEEIGVLPRPQRTPASYRQYDEADLARLRFIGQAKAIGLTLIEISEVLALREQRGPPCSHVRALLDHKLEAVDAQVRVLTAFRQEVVALREGTAETCSDDGTVCGIIERYTPGGTKTSTASGGRASAGETWA